MPRFEPFPGLRYDPSRVSLADVTAPPYDVIDDADRAALAARHPRNVVVLDLPVGDDCYGEAGRCLRSWLDEGTLVQDPPVFYGYRMRWTDSHGRPAATTGVLGALELSRPGEGGILPHEHTTKKAKTDRLDLLRGARANLSPVWALSPADGLTDLLADAPDVGRWAWSDAEGVSHELWVIADPAAVAAIEAAVDTHPVVIADGHHRYETSLAYRDERAASEGDAGAARAALVFVVELVDHELQVAPIHRLVDGLPPGFDLAASLAPWFDDAGELTDDAATDSDALVAAGTLALVLPDRIVALRPRPDAFDGVRDLDTSRVEAALAGLPPHTVTYQHGARTILDRVRGGDAQAGLLVRPAPVAQILEIAHGGERMPPKTTFFWPKPRTGTVFRLLD